MRAGEEGPTCDQDSLNQLSWPAVTEVPMTPTTNFLSAAFSAKT